MYWWWVKDVTQLDQEAILEGVMNYGTWGEFLHLKNEWGKDEIRKLFNYMVFGKRVSNLRKPVIALYTNYLKKYASY